MHELNFIALINGDLWVNPWKFKWHLTVPIYQMNFKMNYGFSLYKF